MQARILPTLICTGKISEIEDGKVSSSGNYAMNRVHISGEGAGDDAAFNFLYRPEWLRWKFDRDTLEEKYGTGGDFVYRNCIESDKGLSFLQGMAGNTAAFNEALDAIMDLEEITLDGVTEVLRRFVGQRVGYVLSQKFEKIVDPETGEKVGKVRVDGYEVKYLFYPTPEELKRLRVKAEKSDGSFVFCGEVPF